MKRGKEIKMDYSPYRKYNVVYGTINNKEPKAIYINLSAWGEPHENAWGENVNYDRVIRNLHKRIKQFFYDELKNDFIRERTIVDLDMRESGISLNKRSFMSCEITLYQKEPVPINDPLLIKKIETITSKLIDNVFDGNDNFNFFKKKI